MVQYLLMSREKPCPREQAVFDECKIYLRAAQDGEIPRYVVGDGFILDRAGMEIDVDGKKSDLLMREYLILCRLAEHPGAPVPQIRFEPYMDPRAVRVYIHQLRNKMGPSAIRRNQGKGYSLRVATIHSKSRVHHS